MSTLKSRDLNDQPDLASHLHDLGPTACADNVSSAVDAAPTPDRMQDMEQSLVERIADIDDERRRTSTQLRKALRTHVDDVEARLVIARRALVALAIVVALLAAGVIWLGTNLQAQQRQLTLDISEQQAQPADSSTSSGNSLARDVLAERVAHIERQLAELAANAPAAPTSGPSPAPTSKPASPAGPGSSAAPNAQNGTMDLEQVAPSRSSIADSQDSAEAQAGFPRTVSDSDDVPRGADGSGGQDAESTADMRQTAADAITDQSRPAPILEGGAISIASQDVTSASSVEDDAQESPRSPDDLQAEQERLQAQIAAVGNQQANIDASDRLPIDELIDDQLDRLEREYQRLARQVDAPAVQQSRAPESVSAALSAPASAPTSSSNGSDGDGQLPIAAAPAPSAQHKTDKIETTEVSIALQLIGFHSREELNAFLSDQALPNPYYIRRETFRNRPWFALIHSLHENREAAGATAEALPEDLARLDLWVRELPKGTTLERVQIKADD